MTEGYLFSLVYKKQLARIPSYSDTRYVAPSIVEDSCTIKMSVTPLTVPLQIMCQLIVAGQAGENVTVPLNWNAPSAETTDSWALPPEYIAFPEFGVAYKSFDTDASHNEARKMCLKENGQLSVIDSREKIEKIINRFGHINKVWAGVGQYGDTDEWITIDGKSTNDLPWGSGFPYGNYRCAYLSKGSESYLVNNSCENRYRYLCEIALPKN